MVDTYLVHQFIPFTDSYFSPVEGTFGTSGLCHRFPVISNERVGSPENFFLRLNLEL